VIDETSPFSSPRFYCGRGAYLRDWIYEREGRIVFSLHDDSLEVLDVVYNPDEGK
jgi:hypothetical protein